MIVDSGPLLAILDRNDPAHDECLAVLRTLDQPLRSTWPVFTEAMHLVGQRAGKGRKWFGHDRMWRFVLTGQVELCHLGPSELKRCYDFMHKYRDLPMALADATLVAFAESIGSLSVFTLDSDFDVYRIGRRAFDVVP